VVGRDAHDLGINMISYALATFDLAQFYAHGGVNEPFIPLTEAEQARGGPVPVSAARGDFLFAQLLHEGRPDPDPTAFARLLEVVMANTSVRVRLSRKLVRPAQPELNHYPFLYMTGHEDFQFSEKAVGRLRRHLSAGGFLLADSCCGNLSFDVAFRRQMARVFPKTPLKPLAPQHPIYRSFWTLDDVALTPRAAATYADMTVPYLEGIEIDGTLRVLYSPLDLGNGWEGIPHPYARGYAERHALRIGVNAIVYALSH
jgi:hypothetical protein